MHAHNSECLTIFYETCHLQRFTLEWCFEIFGTKLRHPTQTYIRHLQSLKGRVLLKPRVLHNIIHCNWLVYGRGHRAQDFLRSCFSVDTDGCARLLFRTQVPSSFQDTSKPWALSSLLWCWLWPRGPYFFTRLWFTNAACFLCYEVTYGLLLVTVKTLWGSHRFQDTLYSFKEKKKHLPLELGNYT